MKSYDESIEINLEGDKLVVYSVDEGDTEEIMTIPAAWGRRFMAELEAELAVYEHRQSVKAELDKLRQWNIQARAILRHYPPAKET